MKTLRTLLMLLAPAALAFGQAASVPLCNGSNGPNCTDYFGAPNFANSPLPAGTISSITLIAGGNGYSNPVVVIADPTGANATAAVSQTAGVITAVTVGAGGSGYIMPQVTIVDVGPGGAIGAPMCDGVGQPACGTGAMATAIIGPPFTGGIRKFRDPLPDLRLALAAADTTTYADADFYVIGLVQFQMQMHSDLPMTTVRGYCQLAGPTATACQTAPNYLGPIIVAQKNRPVRVIFKNLLPAGAGGNLFIPVDTTYMGAGPGYTQNRATLHLHGGNTPWISDGTPHQWTAPNGETGGQARGASTSFVPDMWFDSLTGNLVAGCQGQTTCAVQGATNDPGAGNMTFYWTNQQGGRLMFYHDHTYGITRLNVYAGEAAGYLLYDPAEENTLAAATAPGNIATDLAHRIPLVLQDKTFVPNAAQLGIQDPTWTVGGFGTIAGTANAGDLWFPHVYTPNQNPADPGGANAFGRWDYGPWFFPPQGSLTAGPLTVPCTSATFPNQTVNCPITPNPSGTPEGFMDTPVVNGKAYPVVHVAPAAYRFQILSAGNDRSWNLSWFIADPAVYNGFSNTEIAMLPAAPPGNGTALPLCTAINPLTNPSMAMGVAMGLLDGTGNPMNGTGLPPNCWPNYGPQPGIPAPQTMWAADGRAGGAPDPRNAGPAWIQVGTEGGLLPAPVVIPPTPINYEQNTRSVTITNVAVHGLWLGPAERADVIVDFSKFAGKTLILYNDAPAPAPAMDSRVDYFTGDGDQTPIGGAPNTPAGYGPNTRTVMQVVVDGNAPNVQTFNLSALKAAFATTAAAAGVFQSTQPTIIVPEAAYNSTYNRTFTNKYTVLADNSMTFTPLAPVKLVQPGPGVQGCTATAPNVCISLERKTIQELFTADYGRMNSTLGTELPLTNFLTQTTIPLGYIDPPTEIIQDGETQLWRVTHNGVDTHFIHFHLFNVQVINRIGWDGTTRPPDPNELGWKDTVRMNPLEDIVVALQPLKQNLPWPVPDSIRLMDTTMPPGMSMNFTGIDPFSNNPATVTNALTNFGWEYVWHCHILGHEESDMMRPIVFQVNPPAPSGLAAAVDPNTYAVTLTWQDNSVSETGFIIQRDIDPAFPSPTAIAAGPSTPANAAAQGTTWGGTITAIDPSPGSGTFYYRVQAVDAAFGPPITQTWNATPALVSSWSNIVTTSVAPPVPSVAPAAVPFGSQLVRTTSTAQTVTLSNAVGAGTLPISGIAINGTNAADFAIAGTTCGAGLAGGLTCTITVTFTPVAVGARTATLAINSTPAVAVPLTGTGVAPTAAVSPLALLFGNVPVSSASAAQTVTLRNTGSAPLTINSIGLSGGNAGDFNIATNTCVSPLAPATSCAIAVAFKPTTMGARSSVLVIQSSDPVSPIQNVSLTGTGTEAIANVSPASLAFALQVVKTTSAAQTVTLSNTGNVSMVINSILLTGANAADFVLNYTCGIGAGAPLGAGGACNLTVAFRPTAAGARSANIAINSNALVTPAIVVPLTGAATAVNLDTTMLTFAPQRVGTTSTGQTVTLTNVGATALIISSITNVGGNGPDFTSSGCPIGGKGLAAGANCKLSVKFSPTAPGLRATTLTIASSDPGMPSAMVALSGTGLQAGAVLSPTSLNFGTVTRGQTSTPKVVTLTNNGNTALTIYGISTGGPQFSSTTTCGTSLGAGAQCTISVTFSPNGTKAYNSTLSVSDNAPGSPQTVALAGTGQ